MISLCWQGPFSFRSILTDGEKRDKFYFPGVYLWLETPPSGVRNVSYVGKATSSLWKRHLQHYASLIGGLYNIPKEFCCWGQDWVPDKQRANVVEVVLDKDRFMAVVEAGFNRAAATEVYLCPLLDKGIDLAAVERQLLFEFQPSMTKRGTMSPPKSSIDIEHLNRPWE